MNYQIDIFGNRQKSDWDDNTNAILKKEIVYLGWIRDTVNKYRDICILGLIFSQICDIKCIICDNSEY